MKSVDLLGNFAGGEVDFPVGWSICWWPPEIFYSGERLGEKVPKIYLELNLSS